MKKIICFSLFGHDPKYIYGAICNIELAAIIYPDWICRFYCGASSSNDFINQLKSYSNVEVVLMNEDDKITYMSWRFLAIDDEDVSIMLSRDTDSRLSFREKYLVDIFEKSDKLFHDIRDHHLHMHTMGGTWGIKKGAISSMKKLLDDSIHVKVPGYTYGADQNFMIFDVAPLVNTVSLVHKLGAPDFPITNDMILSNLINPVHSTHVHHIGEVFPANNYNKPANHVFY